MTRLERSLLSRGLTGYPLESIRCRHCGKRPWTGTAAEQCRCRKMIPAGSTAMDQWHLQLVECPKGTVFVTEEQPCKNP